MRTLSAVLSAILSDLMYIFDQIYIVYTLHCVKLAVTIVYKLQHQINDSIQLAILIKMEALIDLIKFVILKKKINLAHIHLSNLKRQQMPVNKMQILNMIELFEIIHWDSS